jgi:glycosyltransferase involved in cell wall biosynthesis
MRRTESGSVGSTGPGTSVVSLTPTAVERDSRTFKQAASVRRLGYESILVEDVPSRLDKTALPFRLVAPRRRTKPVSVSALRRVGRVTRAWVERRAPAVFTAARNVWHYGPRTATFVPRAGLYYLHAPHQYLGIWLRSLGRTPFVYDAHDFYPAGYESAPPVQALWFRILLWLERRCVREATEVVTVTQGCAELMEACFDRKPVVIPNVHDSRIDEDVTTDLRASLELDAGAFLIVMVGNDKPGTATAEMLDAMSRLSSDVHLALVGRGWEAHSASIEDRGLSRRVHVCGPVSPTQIVPFIASADAAVILYLAHTVDYVHALPNRLFLPIAAGLPLLYPRQLIEIDSVAGQYGFGVPIDPGDTDSMVEAISHLRDDDNLMQRLRDGSAAARGDLSWQRHEPVLRQILETSLRANALA